MNSEGTGERLRADNPHLDGWPIPRSTTLDEYLATVERRHRTTNPCNCDYCEMSEREVEEYREWVRGKHERVTA